MPNTRRVQVTRIKCCSQSNLSPRATAPLSTHPCPTSNPSLSLETHQTPETSYSLSILDCASLPSRLHSELYPPYGVGTPPPPRESDVGPCSRQPIHPPRPEQLYTRRNRWTQRSDHCPARDWETDSAVPVTNRLLKDFPSNWPGGRATIVV